MKVVLDTNVIVSGLLSPFGPPGEIMRMVAAGALELCYDARIISEYKSVLAREIFSFDREHVDDLLEQIKVCGHLTSARPLRKRLPHPDDEPFLEVALAGGVDYLITGNLKHYPDHSREGVRVVSPLDFKEILRTEK